MVGRVGPTVPGWEHSFIARNLLRQRGKDLPLSNRIL